MSCGEKPAAYIWVCHIKDYYPQLMAAVSLLLPCVCLLKRAQEKPSPSP